MAVAHLAQGAWALARGVVNTPWEAFVGTREAGFRMLVGGRDLARVEAGELWRLASTGLVHVDLGHLLVNALAIGVIGRLVEPWIGAWRLAAVACTGVVGGAGLSQLSGIPRSDGASGAAFALVGAGIAVGLRRADLPPEERRLLTRGFGALAALNLVVSLVVPALDAAAHTGGLLSGLALGRLAADGGRTAPWVAVVVAFAAALTAGLAFA